MKHQNPAVRKLTYCALLTAIAMALSLAESLSPLRVLFPVPGLRLGLANLVTLFALCRLSVRDTVLILCARCLLLSLIGGSLTSLWFSLAGGLLSLAVMALLMRLPKLSLLGVGIAGAAAHNTGQILASLLYFRSPAPLLYLPPLLGCSVLTGAVIGLAALWLVRRIPHGHF